MIKLVFLLFGVIGVLIYLVLFGIASAIKSKVKGKSISDETERTHENSNKHE